VQSANGAAGNALDEATDDIALLVRNFLERLNDNGAAITGATNAR